MNRMLVTTLLAAAGSLALVSDSFADQTRLIRQDYEVRRVELDNEYRAKRSANKFAYHRERDLVRAERERALRIACRDTRAIRVRELNRELSALSRSYNLRNREISAWLNNERAALRTSYEIAMRNARRGGLVAPVSVALPANNVCQPPRPTPPPVFDGRFGVDPYRSPSRRPVYDDGFGYAPAASRNSSAINWAGLIFNLLRN